MFPVLSLLWMPLSASAVDWYLESPALGERAEAARIEGIAVRDGFEARVVRRFVDGAGWRYLVRVEAFADARSATAAAEQLAGATGAPIAVLQLDVDRVVRIHQARPPGSGTAVEAGPRDPEPILAAVARAHGTGPETLRELASRPVKLEYRRVLADGRVVRHVWARDRGRTWLEVAPGEGSGGIRPSRTRVGLEQASLSVDGGPWIAQDAAKTARTLDALGPVELLPLVLAVGSALQDRPEFGRMTVVEGGEGGPIVLRYGGDATTGAIELELDRQMRIRRVVFDDGAVVREYDDYRSIAGLPGAIAPWRVRTVRGREQVDRIEIEGFEVGAELPEDWFSTAR